MRLVLLATLLLSSCKTLGTYAPEMAVVNKCLDSGGCWNFENQLCERVDPNRCPSPQAP